MHPYESPGGAELNSTLITNWETKLLHLWLELLDIGSFVNRLMDVTHINTMDLASALWFCAEQPTRSGLLVFISPKWKQSLGGNDSMGDNCTDLVFTSWLGNSRHHQHIMGNVFYLLRFLSLERCRVIIRHDCYTMLFYISEESVLDGYP